MVEREKERRGNLVEQLPKMKPGERYEMLHKGSGQRRKIKIGSRAGEVTSRKEVE